MEQFEIGEMTRGWFVGDFSPTMHRTDGCEVAVQSYPAGSLEDRHHHKLAEEITVVVVGKARINSTILNVGQGVKIACHESAEFEALEDTTTVVFKTRSIAGDKYLDPES